MNKTGIISKIKGIPERFRTNPIWIIFVLVLNYIILDSLAYIPWYLMISAIESKVSAGFIYIAENYTAFIPSIIILFLLTWLFKSNRYIWKSFLPKKTSTDLPDESDIAAEFYGRNRNSIRILGFGLLIGFITNGFAICCALIHHDINLYFDFSVREVPLILFALLSVFIQSTSEEIWCRGFLYERLHERYPLFIAVLINGILFGAMHLLNDGAGFISILSIVVCGISYSLVRWYTGSIWIVMGIHTGWNFTQAFLFGLPNSGLVSEVSVFHLESSTGINNLIYDFTFGVEGGLPAIFTDFMLGVIVLVLAAKNNRLKELGMNREETIACHKPVTDTDCRPTA